MKIVNLRKEKYTKYIGRGSMFGNPFVIGKDGTREDVIKKYEEWIRHYMQTGLVFHESSNLYDAIYSLPESAVLGCFCKPKACHGDIIIKIWKEMHRA